MSKFSSDEEYLLTFTVSHKNPNDKYFSKDCMSSNIVSETLLEDDGILLKKRALLSRKLISSEKIYYRDIIDLNFLKSDLSSIYSAIEIIYSRNGYSKRHLCLSSSDTFAVRWFYDALVVKYSFVKSNLNKSYNINSNEKKWVEEQGLDLNDNESEESKDNIKSINKSYELNSKQSKLSDFVNELNKNLSDDEKKKYKRQQKFDRCSSGEY